MFSGLEKMMDRVADWIKESDKVVIFTGAGVSTESGVPDFRSPGGIWDRYDPEDMTYQNFITYPECRKKYWELHYTCWHEFQGTVPNRAHLAIANLENRYQKVTAVITQNVDELHQKSGNDPNKVLELHGTMWKINCLSCSQLYPWEDLLYRLDKGENPPECHYCGGLLKPATISFGQQLPKTTLQQAQIKSRNADLFISIGSSLVVYPAAMLPQLAKKSGARLVIINRELTPIDPWADLAIPGQAGEVMERIMHKLEEHD